MDLLKLRHGASPDCATTKYVLNGLMSRSKWICWSHSASRPEAVLPVKIKPPNLAIRPMYRIRRQVTAKESHNGPSRIRARPCAARSQPRRAPADRGRQGLGRAEEAAAKERRRQNRPSARAARGGDARRAGQEAGREGVRRSGVSHVRSQRWYCHAGRWPIRRQATCLDWSCRTVLGFGDYLVVIHFGGAAVHGRSMSELHP